MFNKTEAVNSIDPPFIEACSILTGLLSTTFRAKTNDLSKFDFLKFMFFLKETYGLGFMKHGRKKGNCQDSAFFF